MYLFQHVVSTLFLLVVAQLVDRTALVVHVTKQDSIRRTSLLASGTRFAILHRAAFFLGSQLGILQALYAERTFFHHTTATNGNVRVQHHARQVVVHIIAT